MNTGGDRANFGAPHLLFWGLLRDSLISVFGKFELVKDTGKVASENLANLP